MTENILLVIGISLLFMIPSILLIEAAQKGSKEEAKKIVTLRLNILQTTFFGFISLILFSTGGILFLYTLLFDFLDFSEGPSLLTFTLTVFIIGAAVILILDFPIFLNHLIQTKWQTVIWDKERNIVSIIKGTKEISIDLENNQYEIIRYELKWPGTSIGRPPGLDLGKTVILKENERIELSDLLLKEYNLFSVLRGCFDFI